MLLAEIRGKIRGTFACRACGDEAGVDALRSAGIEDAITSHVFGALRHLPTSCGAALFFDLLGLRTAGEEHISVELWPFRRVLIRLLDGGPERELGCEPDVVLESPDAVVVVETKLGMKLGTDPSQLPREARLAHTAAAGRPWRLLCVTADLREPSLPGFVVRDGSLALGSLTTIASSVASYFVSEATLSGVQLGPRPDEVRDSVRWIGWHEVAALLERTTRRSDVSRPAATLLLDVCALLEGRGLTHVPFRGFVSLGRRLSNSQAPWSIRRPQLRLWSNLRALPRSLPFPRLFRKSPTFATLRPRVLTSWPTNGWLAAARTPANRK